MLPGSIEMRVRRVLDTKILPVFNTMRVMKVFDTPSRGCLYTQLLRLDLFSPHHSRPCKTKVQLRYCKIQNPDFEFRSSDPPQRHPSQRKMAPSRKAAVQKRGQAAAQIRPATPHNKHLAIARSASPFDEPPARSTRSKFKAPPISKLNTPTAEQRIPIACPFLACTASTVHEHISSLQHYLPRPERAVRRRGYGNVDSEIGSRPSFPEANSPARQDQNGEPEEPEVVDSGEAVETRREIEDQEVQGGDDEITTQEPLPPTLEQSAASPEPTPEETAGDQEVAATSDVPAAEELSNEGPSSHFQAPMTPPPSSPLASANDAPSYSPQMSLDGPEEQNPATLPEPRIQFGDWLPGLGPNEAAPNTQHVHAFDELIRPLVDPELPPAPGMVDITQILGDLRGATELDPDLPSLMMRPPVTEYMRQFEETEEHRDWETEWWL